jgi:hypothetical protein
MFCTIVVYLSIHYLFRQLVPEFSPKKFLDKRKSQLVFHDDLEPSVPKVCIKSLLVELEIHLVMQERESLENAVAVASV